MSKYELADLQLSMIANNSDIFAIFISLLFAYFALAYIEGNRLSMFQLTSITFVYSAAMLIQMYTMWDLLSNLNVINFVLLGQGYATATYVYAAILISAWITSIVFMVQTRRKNDSL